MTTKTAATYKGHGFRRTETTTDVTRTAFGRQYRAVECVWEVEGEYGKSAMERPFLTSEKACREYVNQRLELAAYYATQPTT